MNKLAAAGALALVAAYAISAQAFISNDAGQKPPAAQNEVPPAAQEETPPPKKECLTDKAGFRNRDGQNEFYVELVNTCDKPVVCLIKAYVIGSEGGKAGSGTLQLGASVNGEEVRETWTIATSENGGMANMSRSCKFE